MTMGKAVGLKTALFSSVHGAESWRSYQYLTRSTSLQMPTRRELVRCKEFRLASDFFNSDKFSCYPPSIHDAHQLPDPGLDPVKLIQNLSLDPDCQIVIRANPTQVGIHGTFPWLRFLIDFLSRATICCVYWWCSHNHWSTTTQGLS